MAWHAVVPQSSSFRRWPAQHRLTSGQLAKDRNLSRSSRKTLSPKPSTGVTPSGDPLPRQAGWQASGKQGNSICRIRQAVHAHERGLPPVSRTSRGRPTLCAGGDKPGHGALVHARRMPRTTRSGGWNPGRSRERTECSPHRPGRKGRPGPSGARARPSVRAKALRPLRGRFPQR